MTKVQKIRIRLLALLVGAGVLLIPVTVSSGSVEANDACADDNCCREIRSICEASHGTHLNYYKSSKACVDIDF